MDDFKSGYGQAKADTLQAIKEATKMLTRQMHSTDLVYRPDPQQKKELQRKIDALRWVNAIVRAQRSPR